MSKQRKWIANIRFDNKRGGIGMPDVISLKKLPEFTQVGEYYLPGQENSSKGYNVSYVYYDSEKMYIARGQME